MSDYKITNTTLYFLGVIDKSTVPKLYHLLLKDKNLKNISIINLREVSSLDSSGVAFLDEIAFLQKKNNITVTLQEMSELVKSTITVFDSQSLPESIPPRKIHIFEAVGNSGNELLKELFEMLVLTSDIFYWSIIGLFDRRGQRKGTFVQQSVAIGVDALPIVGLLSLIIGFIISLQSATQLRQYGADVFLGNLLSISMLRELGPLITAIIVAGRSGSAIASEIATMKVTEEIDALKMMALNPIRYIVVPKFHAVTICMPLLVLFSVLIGIFGGLIIGVYYLGLSVTTFVASCLDVTHFKDIALTMAKSVVFAWEIVIVGSHYGFQVTGGAEGVGKATTIAVVISIFAVIIMDAIFSLFYLI